MAGTATTMLPSHADQSEPAHLFTVFTYKSKPQRKFSGDHYVRLLIVLNSSSVRTPFQFGLLYCLGNTDIFPQSLKIVSVEQVYYSCILSIPLRIYNPS
jgi:hypothetical protein